MSEIKGQLLGIILVIMVFGIVAGSLTAIFTNLSASVSSEVAKAVSDNQYSHYSAQVMRTALTAVFSIAQKFKFV